MSDIDAVAVDSLKALDPKRPIREADIKQGRNRAEVAEVALRVGMCEPALKVH